MEPSALATLWPSSSTSQLPSVSLSSIWLRTSTTTNTSHSVSHLQTLFCGLQVFRHVTFDHSCPAFFLIPSSEETRKRRGLSNSTGNYRSMPILSFSSVRPERPAEERGCQNQHLRVGSLRPLVLRCR